MLWMWGGKVIDKRYERRRPEQEHWSTYRFPRQQPPDKDFKMWKRAIYQLQYVRSLPTLGRFIGQGHKRWEWRYAADEKRLFRYNGGEMDIYKPLQVPRYSNQPNFWTCSRINQPATSRGVICLVSPVALGVWKVISYAPLEQFPPWPETIQDVFKLWGCTWLWKNIRLQGELACSIAA